MTCGECPKGRRVARDSVLCTFYGMIIREERNCIREGRGRYDGDGDHGENGKDETELSEDGGGTVGEVPGILSGYGK